MNNNFFLFLFYITSPLTWFIQLFVKGYQWQFCNKLYYGKDSIVKFMFTQAQHETANFTSNLYKLNNNCIGMGYTANSPYQLSKTYNGLPGEPTYSAKYKNVAYCLLDYNHYMTQRFKKTDTYEIIVKNAPNSIVEETNGVYSNYVTWSVNRLKQNGYFSASFIGYYEAIERFDKSYKARNILYYSLLLACFGLYTTLFYWLYILIKKWR